MQTIDFKKLQLCDGDVVLDVGCGEGRHTMHAVILAKVIAVGLDLNAGDLNRAADKYSTLEKEYAIKGDLCFQQGDALALPFADNTFDKVICSEVLEHVPNYHGVLAEIHRVLKPRGRLAISVPRAWPEEICWKLSPQYRQSEGGHIRIFNATQLRCEVESLGFCHSHSHWAHALHTPFWWLKCAFWGQEDRAIIRWYHRFLVWDLLKRPLLTRSLEWLLNPLMGKSIVMYFERENSDG